MEEQKGNGFSFGYNKQAISVYEFTSFKNETDAKIKALSGTCVELKQKLDSLLTQDDKLMTDVEEVEKPKAKRGVKSK